MDITLAIVLLVALYIVYMLLISGWLWKLILGIFGWLGMYWYLSKIPYFGYYPFNNDTFTLASIVPTVVILFAMAHTKE